MSSLFSPTLSCVTLGLLLWGLWVGVSDYLGDSFAREHVSSAHEEIELSPQAESVKELAQAEPKNISAQLELARALTQEANAQRNMTILMQAVQAYQAVLQLEPEHPQALLGIATICLEHNIVDQAMKYFAQYLLVKPEDKKARTDFSLALLQGGETERAEGELQKILREDKDFFPAILSLALVSRMKGDLEEARTLAERAKAIAPNALANERIEAFLGSLQEGEIAPTKEEQASPALIVQNYFQNHPVIGPKLQGISWPELNQVKVLVKDFPVEQMPEFAKAKFLGSMKEKLVGLPKDTIIGLYDAKTEKLLLETQVGDSN